MIDIQHDIQDGIEDQLEEVDWSIMRAIMEEYTLFTQYWSKLINLTVSETSRHMRFKISAKICDNISDATVNVRWSIWPTSNMLSKTQHNA